ncbi:DNA polymerase [Rhizobium leguminosarum]|uniref:DNA polymerase n=1 Tax=Rhizobium leguminosarum TaxID=384 RepID=UPI001C92327F|nr:DNA polymerase [Rhizobium leguminosarum]MBY2914149.1 hypothetical protein [Rhizobium leguminosarum]MBY2969688.1 hypothetical protein [Rhizobium leguminosarum]MBY2977061.1 hypothetical protein [Rhizobium leguminosarum]MBY3005611.1 hypothetical protein [Rhizobium leguminosarum]
MHKSSFANNFTFKIEPDEQGGATKKVSINRHNIAGPPDPGEKKKKAVSAHLLIGFDTEYQTIKDRENQYAIEYGAQNDLLSYQFSIKLFDKNDLDQHPEAEGIIIPEADQRLSMEDFIGFAIGSLIEKHPEIILPTSIYLLGHFIRADLPAFSDFKEKARQGMSNIRSTFVTLRNAIPIGFSVGENEIAEFKVSIRDTILLSPANAKSLADIGEMLEFGKIQLGTTPEEDKDIKQNMAKFRAERWPEFREYAIRDAQVCVRYAERVIDQSDKLFKSFKMPTTLTSFGTKLVLEGWKNAKRDVLGILGREKVKEKKFSQKLGHFITTTSTPYMEEVFYEEAFITETYHGGRNEHFLFGVADFGQWRDHDLSSAYTTAMSLIGLPDWRNLVNIDSLDGIQPTDLTYVSVDFEFPDSVRFPTLPVRTSNGILFPQKGHSKCAAPEIFLAMQLGAKLRFRRGVKVPFDAETKVFRDFIRTSIQNRNQHEKGSFDNLFWKEVGNSTYGKTAQGLRAKRVYNLNADDMESLPESKITQPYFASFITSYTRAVLGEILNSFSEAVEVFSVTTDGFLSNANDVEIERATSGPLFQSFAQARKELDQSSEPLEVKHTVHRPIGWRTRGSATLVPGAGSNGIVLQKGGIKTDVFNDTVEENSEIVRLFLNRKPDDKIHYKTGIGIKEMMRNDTDFVFRSVSKRLSMEFDWKRVPIGEKEVDFEFEGQQYTHLTFGTDPIETVAGFDHIRDAWEKYNKQEHHNLKTVADFRNFDTFQTALRIPGEKAALYLKKVDGDLQRLKRDLCRAFQHQQAGFDLMRSKNKVTHGDFRNALNQAGIPCKITDIENAKRKEFHPHQTPDMERVRQALETLKNDYFPELDIGLFLPEGAMEKIQKSPDALAA